MYNAMQCRAKITNINESIALPMHEALKQASHYQLSETQHLSSKYT